jgi:hypothetical protein
MRCQKILVPAFGLLLPVLAYWQWAWPGVALALGAMVMWGLVHVLRLLQVMQRAARQPVGAVASAVMLNARLRPGLPLLQVVALTRSLGALQSPPGEQPEHYRWTDAGASHVSCVFQDGRLQQWQLWRPAPDSA